jgi:hypothetical protein
VVSLGMVLLNNMRYIITKKNGEQVERDYILDPYRSIADEFCDQFAMSNDLRWEIAKAPVFKNKAFVEKLLGMKVEIKSL